MNLKRFVTYIYEYEGKTRRQNAGNIRTDLREDGCLLEAHVRLNDRTEGVGKIFLIAGNDAASPVGIPAGELVLIKGQGHIRLSFPENILGKSGYVVAQLIAFAVLFEDGRLLAASFSGENGVDAACGDFRVWEPVENATSTSDDADPDPSSDVTSSVPDGSETPAEEPTVSDSSASTDVEYPIPNDSETPVVSSDEPPELSAESVSSSQIALRRIALYDLFSLPGANRQLCKNSFLVHGFFNYRYLIEKTVTRDGQSIRFIGVPGVYSPQEQKFSEMYGFPDFEQAEPGTDDKDSSENFGYWIRPL
jgi:hypothetical protein